MAEVAGVLVLVDGAAEPEVVARLGNVSSLRVERRCADLAELLGTARAGVGSVAVLTLRRGVDRGVLGELARLGVGTVLVAAPEDLHRAGALGAGRVVPDGQGVAAGVELAVLEVAATDPAAMVAARRDPRGRPSDPPELASGGPSAGEQPPARDGSALEAGAVELGTVEPARVIAVWSAAGSVGRSTVATSLAAEIAGAGVPTILLDGDTIAPGLVQLLGVLEESAALPALCRAASAGTLDAESLVRRLVRVEPGLELVSGLTRADRWREVGHDSLLVVLEALRARARVVVVDLGGGLEPVPPRGPDRWAASRTVLAEADDVVVLVPPDPVGVRRAVSLLETDLTVPGRRHVVLAQTRPVARGAAGQARDALTRFGGMTVTAEIPYDDAVAGALLSGRSVPVHAPRSAVRLAVRALADRLIEDLPDRQVRARSRSGRSRRLTDWARAPLRSSDGR